MMRSLRSKIVAYAAVAVITLGSLFSDCKSESFSESVQLSEDYCAFLGRLYMNSSRIYPDDVGDLISCGLYDGLRTRVCTSLKDFYSDSFSIYPSDEYDLKFCGLYETVKFQVCSSLKEKYADEVMLPVSSFDEKQVRECGLEIAVNSE